MSNNSPTSPTFDYETVWKGAWNDVTRYGPASRHRRRIVAQLVRRLPHRTVLDLGCGDGILLAELSRRVKADFVGADISAAAIEHARRYLPNIHFEVLGVERMLPDGRFDVTILSEVLEHIEDDDALLLQLGPRTRFVVISVPGGPADLVDKAYGHFRNYADDLLRRKLEGAGFDVIYFRRWGWPFYELAQFLLHKGTSDHVSVAGGHYGFLKKIIAHLLYAVFFLNVFPRGTQVFAVGRSRAFSLQEGQ